MNKYAKDKDLELDIINEFTKADMEDKVRKFLTDIKNIFMSDSAFLASEFEDYALSTTTKSEENITDKNIEELIINKYIFDIDETNHYKNIIENNKKEILYKNFLIKYLDNKLELAKSNLNLSEVIKLSNEINNAKKSISEIEKAEDLFKNEIKVKEQNFNDGYKSLVNKIKNGDKINNLKSEFTDNIINYFRHKKANFLLNFHKEKYSKNVLFNELLMDTELSKLLQSEDIAEE